MGGLKKQNIGLLLVFANSVYGSINGAPASFTSPLPTMASFLALITVLQTVHNAMGGPTKPGAKAQEAKRIAVVTALENLMQYVQNLADQLTPQNAAALIILGGFKVRGAPISHKEAVTVKQAAAGAPTTATAYASLLTAAMASHSVHYHWRYMLPGTTTYVTWTSPTSKTTVPVTPPIPPLTTVVIEASAADANTQTAWMSSQAFLVR